MSGLAREIRSRPPFTEYVSTRWYRAPEVPPASPSPLFLSRLLSRPLYLPFAPALSRSLSLSPYLSIYPSLSPRLNAVYPRS